MKKNKNGVVYNARDILFMDVDSVWAMDSPDADPEITVVFDDGEHQTKVRRLIFSWYLWEIHRLYPDTPLLSTHSMLMEVLSGRRYLKMLSYIYISWFHSHPHEDREIVWKAMYEITNRLYNDGSARLDEYVATMTYLDFVDILENERVKAANANVKQTQNSIDEVYSTITSTLLKDDALKSNPIAVAVRSELVDLKQVHQCVGPRGYVTEIDSTIFKHPITKGYAEGIRGLYESLIESRSATKALVYQKDPLATCEYFNRKMQLVAQSVMRLHPGDCGSTSTMMWLLEANELSSMVGINYLEEPNDEDKASGKPYTIKTLSESDTHLVGKYINVRTPFGCQHSDRQGICEVCYGAMYYSIPRDTSPGHMAAISIGKKTSQKVLSTKHLDGSSKVDEINLGEMYEPYLTNGAEDNTLRLADRLKGLPVKLVVSNRYLKELPAIEQTRNLDDVNITRISSMKEVVFHIGDGPEEEIHVMTVPTSMGTRYGSFTVDFLYYLKRHRPEVNEDGDYVIDLADWPNASALFQLPMKHINMLDFQRQVENFILSSERDGLSSKETPVEALKALLALITSKLDINITHVMTMAYSVAAVDPKAGNYQLPKGGEDFTFCSIVDLLLNRSLSAQMAYEGQERAYYTPLTYVSRHRLEHAMDDILLG